MAAFGNKPLRYLLQAINYTVFMAMVWFFATSPSISLLDDDEGVITIAFAHAGQLREPCRRLTQEELNKLPPNMRKPEDCERERSPVEIEARLDDELFFSKSYPPPGLFGDGGVDVFHRIKVPAGEHLLSLRMNDSVRIEGFNHEQTRKVNIEPAHILLVSFRPEQGFIFDGGAE